MKAFFKEITSIQIITFIFGLLMMVFAACALNNESDTVTIFALMFSVVIIIISAINPDTLLNFILVQTKDGLEVRFDRHRATNKEIEQTIEYANKAEDFKMDDFKNMKLFEEAMNRGIKERSGADFLLIATKLWRDKKYEEALRQAYAGLLNCENIKIKSLLEMRIGTIFRGMNQNNIAENSYYKSIELDSSNHNVYNNLGLLLINKGDIDESEKMFKKAIELNPSDSSTYNNLGALLIKKGDIDGAEKMLKKSIKLNPLGIKVYSNLGIVLMNKGDIDGAEKMYKKAIELNPSDSSAYNNFGLLFKNKEDKDEAENMFKKAIELNPFNIKAYNNLGLLKKEKGEIEESEKLFKKAKQIEDVKNKKED